MPNLHTTYDDGLMPWVLEKVPVGLAITCVYVILDPFESVEVPTLVTRGGTVTTFEPPAEFVRVTDTGIEKVENG